jgi:hypothetical protein
MSHARVDGQGQAGPWRGMRKTPTVSRYRELRMLWFSSFLANFFPTSNSATGYGKSLKQGGWWGADFRALLDIPNLDHDTVKSRKLRHGQAPRVRLGKLLQGSSRSASYIACQDTGRVLQAIQDVPLPQGSLARILRASTTRQRLHAPHRKTDPLRHTLRRRNGGTACNRPWGKSR